MSDYIKNIEISEKLSSTTGLAYTVVDVTITCSCGCKMDFMGDLFTEFKLHGGFFCVSRDSIAPECVLRKAIKTVYLNKFEEDSEYTKLEYVFGRFLDFHFKTKGGSSMQNMFNDFNNYLNRYIGELTPLRNLQEDKETIEITRQMESM